MYIYQYNTVQLLIVLFLISLYISITILPANIKYYLVVKINLHYRAKGVVYTNYRARRVVYTNNKDHKRFGSREIIARELPQIFISKPCIRSDYLDFPLCVMQVYGSNTPYRHRVVRAWGWEKHNYLQVSFSSIAILISIIKLCQYGYVEAYYRYRARPVPAP